jgi:hypothetical protein
MSLPDPRLKILCVWTLKGKKKSKKELEKEMMMG